eukprot:1162012-Pelagomonas_calceolata.AAC.1
MPTAESAASTSATGYTVKRSCRLSSSSSYRKLKGSSGSRMVICYVLGGWLQELVVVKERAQANAHTRAHTHTHTHAQCNCSAIEQMKNKRFAAQFPLDTTSWAYGDSKEGKGRVIELYLPARAYDFTVQHLVS